MTDDLVISDGLPTAAEYAELRRHVGWNVVDPAAVARALTASLAGVVARDRAGELVGMGRVVGDGGVYLYLQDVIVRRAWRGRGLGTTITEALLDRIRALGASGTFVGLMAAEGAAPFYERFGFVRRPDDRPGMWFTL
jgi:GNAT superfamily N-acetyltransferase